MIDGYVLIIIIDQIVTIEDILEEDCDAKNHGSHIVHLSRTMYDRNKCSWIEKGSWILISTTMSCKNRRVRYIALPEVLWNLTLPESFTDIVLVSLINSITCSLITIIQFLVMLPYVLIAFSRC